MPSTSDTTLFRQAQVYALVLGQTVLRLRERHGLTQAALAPRVGLTQSTLSRLERGQTQPDPFVLRQLAGAFGLTVGTLDAYVQDAYQRTEQAARCAVRGSPGEAGWARALEIAGAEGLAGLVAFSVAAVVCDHASSSASQARNRCSGSRSR